RHGAGGGDLLLHVGDEIVRRERVEVVLLPEEGDRVGRARLGDPPRELADPRAERDRAPGAVAVPERHLAGDAGGGGDEHAIARDLLRAPGRRAEEEDLALAELEDHLLVELADAARGLPLRRSAGDLAVVAR